MMSWGPALHQPFPALYARMVLDLYIKPSLRVSYEPAEANQDYLYYLSAYDYSPPEELDPYNVKQYSISAI